MKILVPKQTPLANVYLFYPEEMFISIYQEQLQYRVKITKNVQRWNLKNWSRGLNPPKPGLNSAPA